MGKGGWGWGNGKREMGNGELAKREKVWEWGMGNGKRVWEWAKRAMENEQKGKEEREGIDGLRSRDVT